MFLQEELETFGIDWDEYLNDDNASTINIPEMDCPITSRDYQVLTHSISPNAPSDAYGIDIFSNTLDFVYNHLRYERNI